MDEKEKLDIQCTWYWMRFGMCRNYSIIEIGRYFLPQYQAPKKKTKNNIILSLVTPQTNERAGSICNDCILYIRYSYSYNIVLYPLQRVTLLNKRSMFMLETGFSTCTHTPFCQDTVWSAYWPLFILYWRLRVFIVIHMHHLKGHFVEQLDKSFVQYYRCLEVWL